ncbi:MAG TPA: metallophosphoesterase [Candidatus Kapabacteria bacterium]|jgi:3',5'-cyclic AMP phosphodiesterase CpdA|nr:metallophosphoesterase [Candidatus Kapabacteria bacterium]
MRIAHFSDPHINLKYHPQHLLRLRRALEDAIGRQSADHIVITGDLTSNGNARDLRAIRRLFESLGILSSSKLTVVPGNHDIYGGPHLAEELLNFPDRCKRCDYNEKLAIFQDTFAELFAGAIVEDGSGYPFLKRLRNVCFLGINSIARHAFIENPVGSNGEIAKPARANIIELTKHHAWETATERIVLLHHHLFRRKDISHLTIADGITGGGLVALLEQRTLKLHGKRHILKLFEQIGVDLVLHGHIHFTGEYARHEITCLNSAGAVYPEERSTGYFYHIIDLKAYRREILPVQLLPATRNITKGLHGANHRVTAAA